MRDIDTVIRNGVYLDLPLPAFCDTATFLDNRYKQLVSEHAADLPRAEYMLM